MSRWARVTIVAVIAVCIWMMFYGWNSDSKSARIATVIFRAFMVLSAAGIAAPTRFRIALRIASGMVAVTYLAYFVIEVRALWRGEPQGLRSGQSSATMAGIGLLVIGVPAFVFAFGNVTHGWLDRLLTRLREGRKSSDDSTKESDP